MALHVVLLQGLGALTNDATAKLVENHTAPAPGVSSDKQTQFGPEEGGAGCREAFWVPGEPRRQVSSAVSTSVAS